MDSELTAIARSLHHTMTVSMTTAEDLARECAEMVVLADRDGNQGMADVLRHLGRSHRIKALELAGRLALLEEQYHTLLRPNV